MSENHDLRQVIQTIAASIATKQQRPLDEVVRQVEWQMREARARYLAAGAVYGDTGAGLLRWLLDARV